MQKLDPASALPFWAHGPDWPDLPGVRACMTTRAGGVSLPPFEALNLGDHVGDRPGDVAFNRGRLSARLGARPVFLKQVHGVDGVVLSPQTPDGVAADACATREVGVACTVMVADCLPVLWVHGSGAWVAATHAGWRGLAQGVLEQTLKLFQASAQSLEQQFASENEALNPADLRVWLGPCIGPSAFEVGADVAGVLCSGPGAPEAVARCVRPQGSGGRHLVDLAGLARLRLQALGVRDIQGNDGSEPWCTVRNAAVWFSHRRDTAARGGSGRMAACIWRV
jgi:YfiH family protein